jgi:hypothetical protein
MKISTFSTWNFLIGWNGSEESELTILNFFDTPSHLYAYHST